jgi:photosystem II stability/assembly factor-like uncharacterized protein
MRTWMTTTMGLLLIAEACSAQGMPQASGTHARLRGLSAVDRNVAWAGGAGGTCLRTNDGGTTWVARTVPGASGLDFRDIHAVDADTAYVLSIGAGENSRIYKTSDGGTTWALQHTNRDPRGFLDALAFRDPEQGLALGDPVDGRFLILSTDHGGQDWSKIPAEGIAPALPGEGAFAASGTCLIVQGKRNAWFATGGSRVSRVFRSTDRGRTWSAHETPVRAGTASAGIFSLTFWDEDHGVAVGGDYRDPGRSERNVARTGDGGRTWVLTKGARPAGYRSAVAVVPGTPGPTLVAVGPTGADVSTDGGETWQPLGAPGFDAFGFAGPDVGWAVGEEGRIARFEGVLRGKG